jgi:PAS domain S-box-containing protein
MLNTVSVPKQFEPIFKKAQDYVSKYFSEKTEDASKGKIEIFGQRYILIRAASVSVDFFDAIKNMFKDFGEERASGVARSLLFDAAHTIGVMDARNFHKQMGLKNPIEKLSAGPIHFSHTGWAFVDILAESRPTPDENYYLIYDHPFSFEADAWKKSRKNNTFCVCAMNAGYSSGWCEESFGIPLVASEIMCRARGDSTCRFIMAHPSKIKQYLEAYLRSHPDISDNATLYKIGGFFQERRQIEASLQESENRYRKLLKSIPQKIFYKDLNSVYVLCNESYADDLKLKPVHVRGRTDYDFYPKELADKYRADDKRIMQSGQAETIEEKYIKDGQEYIVQTCKSPVKDEHGNVIGIFGIFWDITDSKKTKESLEKLNRDLELTVKKLSWSNRELQEFAYVAAHDLKAPLRAIGTLAEWLSTDYSDKFDEQGKEKVELLVGRAKRIDKLIDSILQYSEIGDVGQEKQVVDLNLLLSEVIHKIGPPNNIEITIENELPFIMCSRAKMMQVFHSLLSNAVKYMDKPKGQIRIGCRKDGDFWTFSVSDNGPGIEQKYFEKIFKIFQMLATRDEVEAVGIGLPMTRKIVELYGGRIWVQSEPGQGSTFYFTLPMQEMRVKK